MGALLASPGPWNEQKTSADRPKNTTRRQVRLQDYQCGLQSRWVAELRPLPGKNAVSEITGRERESHRSDRLVSVWLHVRASSGEENSRHLDVSGKICEGQDGCALQASPSLAKNVGALGWRRRSRYRNRIIIWLPGLDSAQAIAPALIVPGEGTPSLANGRRSRGIGLHVLLSAGGRSTL